MVLNDEPWVAGIVRLLRFLRVVDKDRGAPKAFRPVSLEFEDELRKGWEVYALSTECGDRLFLRFRHYFCRDSVCQGSIVTKAEAVIAYLLLSLRLRFHGAVVCPSHQC